MNQEQKQRSSLKTFRLSVRDRRWVGRETGEERWGEREERERGRERVPHPQTQRERNAWVVLVLVVSVILGIFIILTLHRFSDLSLAAWYARLDNALVP